MAERWVRFWWRSITGPRDMAMKVVSALCDGANMCMLIPDYLPWRDYMRSFIEGEISAQLNMDAFYVDLIDAQCDCPEAVDVGRYLLERYATPAVAASYRGRERIQKYIADNRVLDRRIVWVFDMSPAQEKKWLQFCREYSPSGEQAGRIVLEARHTERESPRRNLAVVRYRDMVRAGDLALFCSIYARERTDYTELWQQYASTLCALMCGTDAQTALALLKECDFTSREPACALRELVHAPEFELRGEGAHILNLVRREDTDAIDALIWQAQLQVLFPLIELERVRFIGRYREDICAALACEYFDVRYNRAQYVDQFGAPIESPDDVEMGTVYRMMNVKQAADRTQYLLYIPGDAARRRIKLLHELRNALAHGNCCPVEVIAEFINGYPFEWGS